MRIAILGAGAWGTALALSLCPRHHVTLWVWDPADLAQMRRTRVNGRYLPGFEIPPSVALEGDAAAALAGRDLALVVVPTSALRETLERIAAHRPGLPVVAASKGFEPSTARLPHQVAAEILGPGAVYGVLSGPSFAQEVARGLPTAVTLASADPAFADAAARALHSPRLRVYSSTDVVGVEIGGAVKNVMAIAAGICDGLGFGYNARAALITRGLAEITRLGLKLGGRQETFLGLAGAGDLILTCTGDLSRNRRVGLLLAQGKPLKKILERLGHVAEGVHTAREVRALARRIGVEMPITEAVCQVLFEGLAPSGAVEALLAREPKPEHPTDGVGKGPMAPPV
ncbi:NAD(P)H-dependent glycerol-3-phosphate dehydrogenase [Pelomicrobium methylotrophicum]|uniref:Glycerol-3-phosphate dehydrogenase [NAD(P)+] n=1 Tax=Pelomicrobium methylotrophicum TaxID=2602750 RepID=A0A5C7ELY1_9PROT|nr:NAD(P)H-dependent glycerol-3-phosphate dehydrogenase [Pelomicrobium methylotrophicum]TXF13734.1 NAD(P)-dependent glycerol-3-phosphate dehydrogenase [Pelomicrobium methylotrophicum]